MDWRSGKANTTNGSAFRGIPTRGRGRGRGSAPQSGRGNSTSTPASTPSQSAPSPPKPSTPQGPPSANPLPRPRPPASRRPHPRRAPSLTHLEIPKAPEKPTEQPVTPGGRPQITRRASHNPPSTPQNQAANPIPSVKLDPSSPITPASPRPKPTRKRSHNRTRSSSKASTQGQLSTAPSVASLKDKAKEVPPHLPMASAPPDIQSFGLRTNIDTLVERVRAMAMAGSSVDRDRERLYTPSEGHIDWAGDEDDTLPDLDDWVRPKSTEAKETGHTESDQASEKPVLSPVKEVTSSDLPVPDKSEEKPKEKPEGADGTKDKEKAPRIENPKEVKELKVFNEANLGKGKEFSSGKNKTRGRGRTKGSVSENNPTDARSSCLNSLPPDAHAPAITTVRQPLIHPLPPKPQFPSVPRYDATVHTPSLDLVSTTATVAKAQEPLNVSPGEMPVQLPGSDLVEPVTKSRGEADVSQAAPPGPRPKKKAFDPSVDWAKAPWPSDQPVSKVDEAAAPLEPRGKKRAFDPSVDWAKSLYPSKTPSPTRRSPTRPSSSRSGHFSPHPHPHTAPLHGVSRGSSYNNTSRVFLPNTQPTVHSRSQMNSPESSPRRSRIREGQTHSRAHSSPQTGPGTRSHSRPVITLDAISRISRTLGVPDNSMPSRGQVAISD